MDKCNFKQGPLPECAPLALAQTPMQQSNEPAYDRRMALARGTLFPGLDLPFMNMVNKPGDLSTPLCELMAMDFVIRAEPVSGYAPGRPRGIRDAAKVHPPERGGAQAVRGAIRPRVPAGSGKLGRL